MQITSRRKKIAFFVVLGICLVALAVTLNVSWIILNWRQGVLLFFGVIFFAAIILGLILNTGFLVREIRRNEQHDSFINAVTHELKTPITSIRLYLETLQRRDVDETQRQQFYKLMLDDTDRLRATVEQVLKAGEVGYKHAARESSRSRFRQPGARMHGAGAHAAPSAAGRAALAGARAALNGAEIKVHGDADELRTAISNILDNAIKYSGSERGRVRAESTRRTKNAWCCACATAAWESRRGELKRIFKRFYRVPRSARVAGERHRTGPVHRSRHRARARRQSVCRKRRRSSRHHGDAGIAEERRVSRVLVVEDEAHLAEGLRFNLEAEGHSVRSRGRRRDGDRPAARKQRQGKIRRRRAGRDASRHGRLRRRLRAAQGEELRARADADGARPPRRRARGIRGGSRRLPSEAFRAADFSGAPAGPAAPQRVADAARISAAHRGTGSTRKADANEGRTTDEEVFSFDGRTIDFGTLELRTKDNTIHLTLMEAKLLRHLIRSNGQTVSRKSILEDVWGLREDTDTRAIDNFIVRLRRYIEEDPSEAAPPADGPRRGLPLRRLDSRTQNQTKTPCNHIGTPHRRRR